METRKMINNNVEYYPLTHISAVLVTDEMSLDQYLDEIIKIAPHVHGNKDVLDLITKEFTVEKDKLISNLEAKISSIKKKEVLSSSTWFGTGAPYTYLINIEKLTASSEVSIIIDDDITAEEYTAFKAADINITSSSIGEGVLTLKAFGELPTIDIPIVLNIKGLSS